MVNHPRRKANPIVALVRAAIGRRSTITRQEMRDLLAALEGRGLELNNGWQSHRPDGDHAQAWADMCTDITVISVLAGTDPAEARLASSNPGSIRYDQPGSMHPMLRATLMFVPAALADQPYDQIGQLRAKAKRVLIVAD